MGSDLEIEIRPGATPGTYEVEVDSPAGTATGTMTLDAESILGRRRELAASVLASAVTSRSTYSTMEAPVREVGHALFEALFADRVYGRYTASLQESGRQGVPLRVVLRLRAPDLAGIPWETLFDPETGEYLCQREPIVRYVEAAQPSAPLAASGPLRILGMVAAPNDLPALDTAEERRRLDDALGELQEQGLVEMVWVEAGSWSALQQKLTAGPWHVLHVIGHGGVRAEGGVLALENEQTGASTMVTARRFARLLHACRPVPRLVVLNACSSGESAVDDLLSSTAAALVHSGITASVAMQFAVTDPAALAFSRGFYQAMSQNIPVDEAVRLGRIAIDGTSEQTLEWVTPVVYLRSDDTRLFELTSSSGEESSGQDSSTVMPEEGEEISHEAAKYGLYVQALAAARRGQYDEAGALFDSLATLDPTYRDTSERRKQVRRDQRLEHGYAAARGAEEQGDWEGARRSYRAVLDVDPEHRDARLRHEESRRQLAISSLQDELRIHASENDWASVLAVSTELSKLAPDAADPEGLATRARRELDLDQPAPPPPPGNDEGNDENDNQDNDQDDDQDDDQNDVARPRRRWKPLVKLTLALSIPVAAIAVLARVLLGGSDDPPAASPPPASSDPVTCWNGGTADAVSSCPRPDGQEGLASVFPSLEDSCEAKEPSTPGKAEIFECVYDGYTIRYSRWQDDYDTSAYFDSHIKNATKREWSENGVSFGTLWTGLDDRTSEERRHRTIAAYADWPYDVTVKGVDQAALQEGVDRVQAKQPDEIGLP